MPKPERHIIVCTNQRPPGHPKEHCQGKGSYDVLQAFLAELDARSLLGRVIVTGSTCLGPCGEGPTAIVYPDSTWYGRLTPEDAKTIVESHIVADQPVERLQIPESAFQA